MKKTTSVLRIKLPPRRYKLPPAKWRKLTPAKRLPKGLQEARGLYADLGRLILVLPMVQAQRDVIERARKALQARWPKHSLTAPEVENFLTLADFAHQLCK